MFAGFANVWTPAVIASRLGKAPLRVVVAGEPIVFFRDNNGAVGALLDRCPHRATALSLGRIQANGCLECPLHGWQFDVCGNIMHVPLNPHAKRDLLPAVVFPVRQVGGMLWIYTAPGLTPPSEPFAPIGLTAETLTRTYVTERWNCHWTRVMENMLDSAHVPYVHRRTIGRHYRHRLLPSSRMTVSWEETSWGGRARSSLDGEASPAFLEFFRPNVMALDIAAPGRHLRIHALVMPIEDGATQLTIVGSRDFARNRLLNPWFSWINGIIAGEDKAVVESAGASEVPRAGGEPSVETDRATLQFRKYYDKVLRDSGRVA